MRRFVSFLAAAAIFVSPVVAKEGNPQSKQQEAKTVIQKKEQTAQQLIESSGKRSTEKVRAEELQKIIQEAVDIYQKGNYVLFLLTHNKVEEAKKELKALKEKVDKIEKKYQGKLERLPIDAVITEISGITDLKKAEELAKQVKEAVNNNDFIKARFLLSALRDEIVVQTAYLPIALYKEAIDLAYKFLQENKVKNAIDQLQVALGTVEIETTIIPKPIAIASLLVEDAQKAYKKDPQKALKLLEEAKRQLKLAKVLGYVKTEEELKPLITQIENLEKSIKEKSASSEEKFKQLFKSIEKTKEKATQTK